MTLCEAGSTPVSMTLDSPIASYTITGGTFANDAIVQDTILQFDANLDGLINFFTVTIQTQTGCEIVEEFVLYQAQNTEADFVVIEPFCKDGEVTIQFTGTATPIATLNWDLGEDGVIVNQSGNTTEPPNSVITASWPSEGSKLIALEVDDNGCTDDHIESCLLYTSPSPRDKRQSRMPSSA